MSTCSGRVPGWGWGWWQLSGTRDESLQKLKQIANDEACEWRSIVNYDRNHCIFMAISWLSLFHGHHTNMIMYCSNQSTTRAGIFKQSMGPRHRVGIGLSYRPARLHRLAESIPGPHKHFKVRAPCTHCTGIWPAHNALTLFYTGGLGIVLSHVMVPLPYRFSLWFFT